MKRNLLIAALAIHLMAFGFPASGFAETASVSATKTTIDPLSSVRDGTVTVAGTTDAAEVIVKVVAPDGTILFYDIVKSVNGLYSTSFALPVNAPIGTYQVVAGQGANVSNTTFDLAEEKKKPSPERNSGGGGIPAAPNSPAASTPPSGRTTVVEIKPVDLPKAQNGQVTLDLTHQTPANLEVTLPANTNDLIGNNSLKLDLPSGSITIPKELLESAASLVSGKREDASLSLRAQRLTAQEAESLISRAANESSGAVMKPQGEVLDLALIVKTLDNQEQKLSVFTKPVTLKLKVDAGPNAKLAGIYYVADNGTTEYVGGKLEGDTITADVHHFSTYGVFSYSKTYSDLPEQHWASAVVRELTAKHIVQGISDDRFGPEQKVTRAEFLAMLVRHLGLKAANPAAFKDVPANSWFAQDVAAAYENGIAQGTGAETFEPNKQITREEMAAMIVRVYEKVTGKKAESAPVAFGDGNEIADWAKVSVQSAVKAGLMAGRSENGFAPKGETTRAEASQALYNLINKQ